MSRLGRLNPCRRRQPAPLVYAALWEQRLSSLCLGQCNGTCLTRSLFVGLELLRYRATLLGDLT